MAETDKAAPTASAPEAVQPGSVIAPGSDSSQPSPAASEVVPDESPQSEADPAVPTEPEALPSEAALAPDPSLATASPSAASGGSITWTASEFIAHEKSAIWYIQLGVGALLLATVVYLFTKDVISTGVVIFAALALGVYGARQPRQLQYVLDDEGIKIGPKLYQYTAFRSFAIMPEGVFSSIVLMPLKRFAPLTTIYYDPKDEEHIIDILSPNLPFEERKSDAVERLMRRIRF